MNKQLIKMVITKLDPPDDEEGNELHADVEIRKDSLGCLVSFLATAPEIAGIFEQAILMAKVHIKKAEGVKN